ncbi:uncharacterized protein MELLADRAFT_101664 [Melampsora larici-populina 98AG31]|uniref:Uncharacterized protein n=1 Tax=Melampsora larici-populina (strain 98AG31 / pathotype 3-4-7) TaxID=747676 RepID=F4R6K5_MELLP|nr:uncharacterized protein MELLADRAFT_101664 [Melampsora larici-populina 98AG31]EGG12448.1 hypothetical protein MELLADRAFT_101664 [Melampsora larici-populina 98AG31]
MNHSHSNPSDSAFETQMIPTLITGHGNEHETLSDLFEDLEQMVTSPRHLANEGPLGTSVSVNHPTAQTANSRLNLALQCHSLPDQLFLENACPYRTRSTGPTTNDTISANLAHEQAQNSSFGKLHSSDNYFEDQARVSDATHTTSSTPSPNVPVNTTPEHTSHTSHSSSADSQESTQGNQHSTHGASPKQFTPNPPLKYANKAFKTSHRYSHGLINSNNGPPPHRQDSNQTLSSLVHDASICNHLQRSESHFDGSPSAGAWPNQILSPESQLIRSSHKSSPSNQEHVEMSLNTAHDKNQSSPGESGQSSINYLPVPGLYSSESRRNSPSPCPSRQSSRMSSCSANDFQHNPRRAATSNYEHPPLAIPSRSSSNHLRPPQAQSNISQQYQFHSASLTSHSQPRPPSRTSVYSSESQKNQPSLESGQTSIYHRPAPILYASESQRNSPSPCPSRRSSRMSSCSANDFQRNPRHAATSNYEHPPLAIPSWSLSNHLQQSNNRPDLREIGLDGRQDTGNQRCGDSQIYSHVQNTTRDHHSSTQAFASNSAPLFSNQFDDPSLAYPQDSTRQNIGPPPLNGDHPLSCYSAVPNSSPSGYFRPHASQSNHLPALNVQQEFISRPKGIPKHQECHVSLNQIQPGLPRGNQVYDDARHYAQTTHSRIHHDERAQNYTPTYHSHLPQPLSEDQTRDHTSQLPNPPNAHAFVHAPPPAPQNANVNSWDGFQFEFGGNPVSNFITPLANPVPPQFFNVPSIDEPSRPSQTQSQMICPAFQQHQPQPTVATSGSHVRPSSRIRQYPMTMASATTSVADMPRVRHPRNQTADVDLTREEEAMNQQEAMSEDEPMDEDESMNEDEVMEIDEEDQEDEAEKDDEADDDEQDQDTDVSDVDGDFDLAESRKYQNRQSARRAQKTLARHDAVRFEKLAKTPLECTQYKRLTIAIHNYNNLLLGIVRKGKGRKGNRLLPAPPSDKEYSTWDQRKADRWRIVDRSMKEACRHYLFKHPRAQNAQLAKVADHAAEVAISAIPPVKFSSLVALRNSGVRLSALKKCSQDFLPGKQGPPYWQTGIWTTSSLLALDHAPIKHEQTSIHVCPGTAKISFPSSTRQ